MKTEATDDTDAMTIELRNQRPNSVSSNSRVKLPNDAPVGTNSLDDNVPNGLSAADSTNTIGTIANASTSTPTRCRQPTCRIHRVMNGPPRGGGCGGS